MSTRQGLSLIHIWDAGISASQLGKVLLVGGSTRMPAVERQVRELLGREPSHSLNPDECVAMGAAVQGALLQGGGKLAGATGAAAQGLVLMLSLIHIYLRFQLATGQLENPMRIHEVKKDIARIKTVQREDELKAAKKA